MVYPGFETVRGWCPAAKAERLEALSNGALVCVEVGVFGGQSFFAMGYGSVTSKLFAIDPWSMREARQKSLPDAEGLFDWEQVYRDFRADLLAFGVAERTTVLRMTSNTAVAHFADRSICLLHLDGNHDEDKVLMDVIKWLPKMRKHGVIILDDVDWASVRSAFDYLSAECELVENYGTWAEFVVL